MQAQHAGAHQSTKHSHHYRRLGVMLAVSFVSMYVLMYAMVDSFGNVFNNVNQVYMAALMSAPMGMAEIVLMRSMYTNQRLNAIIGGASVAVLVIAWMLIRQQAGVTDVQFLRSMIPHHGGAILMCRQASIHDADILKLCDEIVAGQQSEIDLMKAKLAQLSR